MVVPETLKLTIPATTEKTDEGSTKKYTAFVLVLVAEVRRRPHLPRTTPPGSLAAQTRP